MMKRGGTLLAVAALLLLTGCSAPEAKPPVEAGELPTSSATSAPSAAPLKMSSSSATPSADSMGGMDPDEFLIASLDGALVGVDSTDQELIAAAKLACEQLESGNAKPSVVLGGSASDRAGNNKVIVNAAKQVYCPKYFK